MGLRKSVHLDSRDIFLLLEVSDKGIMGTSKNTAAHPTMKRLPGQALLLPVQCFLFFFLNHGRWNNHSLTVKMYVSDKNKV